MLLKQVMEVYDLADRPDASGELMKGYLLGIGKAEIIVNTIAGPKGKTDFIKVKIPGKNGRMNGGTAPTIGLLGRLGGIGARPEIIGFVSDGDGAVASLAAAAKILDMQAKGDFLEGDAVVCTHICPNAPTQPHEPVPFMGSPVEMSQVNQAEVDDELDAILSADTTKGNRVINTRGFAISPTVKEGYILKVSSDLLDIMQTVTGKMPYVFPLSTQDITPYGNGLFHLNSILQPSTATGAPVVGVAITTEVPVAGCATGASHFVDVELTARYMLEVAKAFTRGKCSFYDEEEFGRILSKYGPMTHIQTLGRD